MLRELLSILRGDNPLGEMGRDFSRMVDLTREMTQSAGEIYLDIQTSPEARQRIYERDREVNGLQRALRKGIVAHLSVPGNTADLPYCLALMSLVKDVERLGDYAKNVAEIVDLRSAPLPADEQVTELRSIRGIVDASFRVLGDVVSTWDRARAQELIKELRTVSKRCDALIRRISSTAYDANTTTALVLGARYYKRIGGHVLNVLSSVVMPLHKLDYYDEDEPPR